MKTKSIVTAVILFACILATTAQTPAPSPKTMKCTLTGKEVNTCCCESRPNGKMFCKLAKKEIDKCCCEGM